MQHEVQQRRIQELAHEQRIDGIEKEANPAELHSVMLIMPRSETNAQLHREVSQGNAGWEHLVANQLNGKKARELTRQNPKNVSRDRLRKHSNGCVFSPISRDPSGCDITNTVLNEDEVQPLIFQQLKEALSEAQARKEDVTERERFIELVRQPGKKKSNGSNEAVKPKSNTDLDNDAPSYSEFLRASSSEYRSSSMQEGGIDDMSGGAVKLLPRTPSNPNLSRRPSAEPDSVLGSEQDWLQSQARRQTIS